MTDLIFAGKCGCFGARGSSNSAAEATEKKPAPDIKPLNAAPLKPSPEWIKKSRRDLLLIILFPFSRMFRTGKQNRLNSPPYAPDQQKPPPVSDSAAAYLSNQLGQRPRTCRLMAF